MLSILIAEATVCDFKEALEVKKPKSWLKSVSAFANTSGGTLFFGVDNAHNLVGLSNPQKDAEDISRLIKERISPVPRFILTAEEEQGKVVLVLSIPKGTHTPYYYKADGIREAYIRLGDESIVAPDHILHELILEGMKNPLILLSRNMMRRTLHSQSSENVIGGGQARALMTVSLFLSV